METFLKFALLVMSGLLVIFSAIVPDATVSALCAVSGLLGIGTTNAMLIAERW